MKGGLSKLDWRKMEVEERDPDRGPLDPGKGRDLILVVVGPG